MINFIRLDAARVKVTTEKSRSTFEPMVALDGLKKYKIAILPMVLEEEVWLGVDQSR